ncbi:protein mono-ADP-ribosyltransferase PARP9 isoform X2 [Mixophyes fleayi]
MEAQKKIPISEDSYRQLLSCQSEVNDLLIRKFHCAIELKGPKPGSSAAESVKPVVVYEKRPFQKKVLVSVWKDDLTRQDTDVVVNAANDRLDHIGGLALALVTVGGPKIAQESKDYISRYGKLKAGDIAVTSAGNLPCKKIVHAVGPMWLSDTPATCQSELQQVVREVLDYVMKHKDIRSVAIPAVSSGIFGFPLDFCADIIVNIVRSFIYNASCDHLKEIRFVNHDDKTVQAMKSACEQILGVSDTISGGTSPSPYPGSSYPHQASYQPEPPSRKASFPNMSPSMKINGLNIHLIHGLIEDQKTTVIVNSVSSNLDLSYGVITKAILNKAGYSLQTEINKKRSYSSPMIPTKGYNLSCDFVYHVILPLSHSRSTEQVLSQVTHECLRTACKYGSNSISFPALGTGNVGLSKQTVARIMTEAVVTCTRNSQHNMDVFFVIYPSDKDTFKAFQDAFSRVNSDKNTESRAERRAEWESSEVKEHFRDEETSLTIDGPSREDVEAAAAFLDSVVRSWPVVIQNNHIVLFGNKEHDILASPDFPDVSIHLENGTATLKIDGPRQNKVKAAVLVERLLLEVEKKHAESLEEELVEAAVIWFYENKTGSHRYSAQANRLIERAYVSQSYLTLKVEPGHVLDIKNLTAEGPTGIFQLRRRCIREYSKTGQKAPMSRHWLSQIETVVESSQEFRDRKNEFRKANLALIKVEKVQNQLLSAVYESKKAAIEQKSKKQTAHHLYQLVHGGFRKQICDVGFQRLYTSPSGSNYGVGIHFKKSLNNILQSFKTPDENGLIYIFQAEVLTGTSTEVTSRLRESPLPLKGKDDLEPCDSLTDYKSSPEHFVIFDCFRAKPLYLFTCRRTDPGSRY